MEHTLIMDQISSINKIREVLQELSKSGNLPHPEDMDICKQQIKDYFLNIKSGLRNL